MLSHGPCPCRISHQIFWLLLLLFTMASYLVLYVCVPLSPLVPTEKKLYRIHLCGQHSFYIVIRGEKTSKWHKEHHLFFKYWQRFHVDRWVPFVSKHKNEKKMCIKQSHNSVTVRKSDTHALPLRRCSSVAWRTTCAMLQTESQLSVGAWTRQAFRSFPNSHAFRAFHRDFVLCCHDILPCLLQTI